jgi:hypothetical protein
VARRYTWLIIAGLTLLGVFAVTRVLGTRGGSIPMGHESPQAVLRKAQRALIEGDRARFLECLASRSKDHKAALEALFDYVQAAYKLQDALRGNYGKNAWETFVSLQANPAQFTAPIWPRDEDLAATASITLQGTEARVELPSPAELLTLRMEGVWRIEMFPHGSGVRAIRESFDRATEALRKAREDVGKPGLTPEALAQQVRKQIGGEP